MAKRLTDLFKVGTTVIIKDKTDEIEVWLQKLIPAETAIAIDRASAKRARFLTIKTLPPDDDLVVVQHEELSRTYPDRQALRYLVAGTELVQARESVIAELGAEEEWSKDDYLVGLRAAWTNEVGARIEAGSEDPEDLRVQSELTRFGQLVDKEYAKKEKRIFRELDGQGLKSLEERAFEAFIDGQADGIWLREYRDCQLWLGTREPHDHRKQYFADREEVSGLSFEVLRPLLEAYQEIEVEPAEGKD